MRATPSHPTVILALDGVLDASLGVAIDILRAADRVLVGLNRAPVFAARVVGVERSVRLGSGLRLETEGTLRSVRSPAIVVVPGCNLVTGGELDPFLAAPATIAAGRWLARAAAGGTLLAAGCTAVFVLASQGLLDGRRATTMWALGAPFRARFPAVELDLHQTLVLEDTIWTAGAALSMADLALALVRRHAGAQVAELCLRYLALDTRPTQARFFVLDHLARSAPELARAEAWIRAHLAEPFQIEELARACGTSPRTLTRRVHASLGTTPLRLVQRIRVEHAEHLLATTALSLDEVSARVGYQDPSALRRVLRRETGSTARGLRNEARRRRASA